MSLVYYKISVDMQPFAVIRSRRRRHTSLNFFVRRSEETMNIAGGQSERMNSVVGSDDDCGGKEPMTRRVDLIVVSILLLGCSMLLLPSPVAGQAGEANIVGVVSDRSGAVIVGATVTVVSTATGLTRTTKTETDGAYTIANTPPGPYKVTVSQAGFAGQESQIVLLTGTSPNLNFTLSPAGSKQNVTVQGLSPEIETNTATLHTTVTPQQVDDLPINGRDFSTLAALVPGATTGNQAVGKNYDPTKSNVPAISINGQSGRNLYMTIDGGDNTDIFMGGQNITLSLEAVQEFEVITHDPKAEYSRGIGGVVNVVTKSGSNNFHGSAFGFFRTDTLQSIDPISESLHKPKPPFGSQQMGGTIGARIEYFSSTVTNVTRTTLLVCLIVAVLFRQSTARSPNSLSARTSIWLAWISA